MVSCPAPTPLVPNSAGTARSVAAIVNCGLLVEFVGTLLSVLWEHAEASNEMANNVTNGLIMCFISLNRRRRSVFLYINAVYFVAQRCGSVAAGQERPIWNGRRIPPSTPTPGLGSCLFFESSLMVLYVSASCT